LRVPEETVAALVGDNAFRRRTGRPDEYAKFARQIVESRMPDGQCLRLDAGVRFAPK